MDGRTNERMPALTTGEWKERTNKRPEDVRMDRQTNVEQKDGRTDKRMNGMIDKWYGWWMEKDQN